MFSSAAILTAAMLLGGWFMLFDATSAQAGHSGVVSADYTSDGADQTYVRAVGFSSPEAEQKLKWMPIRPTKDQVGLQQVVAIAEQGPALSTAEPIPLGAATKVPDAADGADPFNDPFGDAEGDGATLAAGQLARQPTRSGCRLVGALPERPP